MKTIDHVHGVAVAGALLLAGPAFGQFTYGLDDGIGNAAGPGPGSTGPFVWGNVFDVAGGNDVVTAISVALGSFPADVMLDVLLFEDPNDDGDPRDGVLVACGSAVGLVGGSNAFNTVAITPTRVSGKFFAAARATLGSVRSYARIDPSPDSRVNGFRTWLFWGGGFDGVNLAGSAFAPNYVNLGVAMVRAEATGTLPCLADVAGPGQTVGGDGETTADDLIVFLNWFFAGDGRANVAGAGQSGCPDGEFTADDIIVSLNRFFGC